MCYNIANADLALINMKGQIIMKKMQNGTVRSDVSLEDFAKVFKVFESFPFFESWSPEEVKEEYASFQNGGIIFGYFTEEGECAGILTMKPYEPGKHPVKYPNGTKVMYLSDVATRFEYRRKGIGTHLFEHAIRHLEVLGYDYIYLRTNEKNSMSYGIAKRCGFKQIYDVIEEVEKRRTDGTVTKDARIFMEKKLSK